MFRLLRDPMWARITLAVLLLSVAFVQLGRWQLHRHQAKVARNAVLDANYDAAPVPLGSVLTTAGAGLRPDQRWTPVTVSGRYEPAAAVLVRNRPLEKVYGYEVIVPLRLSDGTAVLVDRGWLPAGAQFVRPDTIPGPPSGPVTVVLRLVPGEHAVDRQPPPGQELRIDLDRLAARAGGEVYRGAYGQLAQETPAPAQAPRPLPRPDDDLGPHLAYAVQWWAGALAAWVLWGVSLRREAEGGAGAPRRRVRPARPSDEEWEDAATQAQPPTGR